MRSTAGRSCGSGSRAGSTTARSASRGGETVERAVRLAGELRIPLVGELDTSGAELREHVAALHAWGKLAREVALRLGRRPDRARGDRRVRVGPGARARAVRRRGHDRRRVRVRHRARSRRPSSPACTSPRDELGSARVHARQSGVATLVVADEDAGARRAARHPRLPPRPPPRRSARATTSDDPRDRVVRTRGGRGARTADGVLRRAHRHRRRRRRRLVPRAAAAVRTEPRHRARPASTVGPSASSPTSPQQRAGTLDIEASRKAARFVRGATTSTSRSSRSSTRPASSRAATSSGAA